ncbi:MAG: hypothetical protein K0S85_266 [Pseudomonas orientalis]|nr:hypothetical protein [Pseudomonas orientalis]
MTNLYTRTVVRYSKRFRFVLRALEKALPTLEQAEHLAEQFSKQGVPTVAHYTERHGLVLVARVQADHINVAMDVVFDECAKLGRKILVTGDGCRILPPTDEENTRTIRLKFEGF